MHTEVDIQTYRHNVMHTKVSQLLGRPKMHWSRTNLKIVVVEKENLYSRINLMSLGPRETDNIIRMITITGYFKLVIYCNVIANSTYEI